MGFHLLVPGWGSGTKHRSGIRLDLVVLAPYRGRGIGRLLLRAAEARAREAGAGELALSVKAGNAGAIALYSAEGFTETEIHLEKRLV